MASALVRPSSTSRAVARTVAHVRCPGLGERELDRFHVGADLGLDRVEALASVTQSEPRTTADGRMLA